jgi:hypothetical protein
MIEESSQLAFRTSHGGMKTFMLLPHWINDPEINTIQFDKVAEILA